MFGEVIGAVCRTDHFCNVMSSTSQARVAASRMADQLQAAHMQHAAELEECHRIEARLLMSIQELQHKVLDVFQPTRGLLIAPGGLVGRASASAAVYCLRGPTWVGLPRLMVYQRPRWLDGSSTSSERSCQSPNSNHHGICWFKF